MLHLLEAPPGADVIDQNGALRPPVVGGAECAKPLLTSCVPNSELDLATMLGEQLHFVINADGGPLLGVKLIICVAKQDRAFSHP